MLTPPGSTTHGTDGATGTSKDEARRRARATRKAFVESLDPMAHRLAFRALPSPIREAIRDQDCIALYSPTGNEAPALRLAETLIAEGKSLCLPHVVNRMGVMEFRAWAPGDLLEEGEFSTVHPSRSAPICHPDVIFAPLVAFDSQLMRLGQGGGYYDRIFARYENAIRIGIGWSVQQIEHVPADPWDTPLHCVITERSVIMPSATAG